MVSGCETRELLVRYMMREASGLDFYALRADLAFIRERATVQRLLAERDMDRRLGPPGTGRGAAGNDGGPAPDPPPRAPRACLRASGFGRGDGRAGVFFVSPSPNCGMVRV